MTLDEIIKTLDDAARFIQMPSTAADDPPERTKWRARLLAEIRSATASLCCYRDKVADVYSDQLTTSRRMVDDAIANMERIIKRKPR